MNAEPTKRIERNADAAAKADEIESSRLFDGRCEVRIRHGGEVYRLRLTRNGKLILNK